MEKMKWFSRKQHQYIFKKLLDTVDEGIFHEIIYQCENKNTAGLFKIFVKDNLFMILTIFCNKNLENRW